MKKFLIIFAAMFFTLSTSARVCMVSDPTVLVTHDQLAKATDVTNCIFDISTPDYSGLSNENIGTAWGVSKNGNTKEDLKCTVTGISKCSTTSSTSAMPGTPSNAKGLSCWCRMTAPRVGAWVFNHTCTGNCIGDCANSCATAVQENSAFRAAVLALP